jgi:UDP-N-acetylglucosamine--N-acetylmuramyl-(pentapeptide) pyrophosphoryl-undecaprenol N-acetylglucosamine transferase
MKVLISVSGTGGHITPAIAFADHVRASQESCQTVWVTSDRSVVNRFLGKRDEKVHAVGQAPLPYGWSWRLVIFPFKLIVLAVRSLFLVQQERPDLVIGFGGSSSFFVVLAARIFGIPCFIHEQNVLPGRANRTLSPLVKRVLVGFHESISELPKGRAHWVGNPLRRSLRARPQRESRRMLGLSEDRFTLLVLGGSQGARKVNHLMIEALRHMPRPEQIQVIHVSGTQDFDRLRQDYQEITVSVKLLPFTNEMERLYSACDFVLSRAGALTATELAFFGKAALLIPYPYAGRHQYSNAQMLEQLGGAKILDEEVASGERLAEEIQYFVEHPTRIQKMGSAIKTWENSGSTKRMWAVIKKEMQL